MAMSKKTCVLTGDCGTGTASGAAAAAPSAASARGASRASTAAAAASVSVAACRREYDTLLPAVSSCWARATAARLQRRWQHRVLRDAGALGADRHKALVFMTASPAAVHPCARCSGEGRTVGSRKIAPCTSAPVAGPIVLLETHVSVGPLAPVRISTRERLGATAHMQLSHVQPAGRRACTRPRTTVAKATPPAQTPAAPGSSGRAAVHLSLGGGRCATCLVLLHRCALAPPRRRHALLHQAVHCILPSPVP